MIGTDLLEWFFGKVNGEEFLKQMFAQSKAEGVACIPNWYTDRDMDARNYPDLRSELSWDENDCQSVIERFTQLRNALAAIAARDSKIIDEEEYEGFLTPEQEEVEAIYLAPWETDKRTSETIFDIAKRSFHHRAVTDEEQELLEEYQAELNAEAEGRVGEGICAFQQVYLARSLYKLIRMDALGMTIRRKECLLAAAMAVHDFGKSLLAISTHRLLV